MEAEQAAATAREAAQAAATAREGAAIARDRPPRVVAMRAADDAVEVVDLQPATYQRGVEAAVASEAAELARAETGGGSATAAAAVRAGAATARQQLCPTSLSFAVEAEELALAEAGAGRDADTDALTFCQL